MSLMWALQHAERASLPFLRLRKKIPTSEFARIRSSFARCANSKIVIIFQPPQERISVLMAFLDVRMLGPLAVLIFLVLILLLIAYSRWAAKRPQTKSDVGSVQLGSVNEEDLPFVAEQIPTFDIEFEALGLKLNTNGSQVLKDVTGVMKHGRTTAIMGPSGSGKVRCERWTCSDA